MPGSSVNILVICAFISMMTDSFLEVCTPTAPSVGLGLHPTNCSTAGDLGKLNGESCLFDSAQAAGQTADICA